MAGRARPPSPVAVDPGAAPDAEAIAALQREAQLAGNQHTAPPELVNPQVITWLFEPDSFSPVAKIQGGTTHSIITDHLGTPYLMMDAQGRQSWALELDIYGKARPGTQIGATNACPFRYPGQYEDEETGLYYNRFRYYDPEGGGYVSQDPIGLNSRVYNLYNYVKCTVSITDPFGIDWNYVLVSAEGETYYAGRASDNQSLADVGRRHSNNIGDDGRARFGEGDRIRRVTEVGTDPDIVRGIEQRGIEERPLLGRGSANRRGNIIDGISKRKQKSKEGKKRLRMADEKLNGRKVSQLPSIDELSYKSC